ncbi:MAG: tryptophan--tRNA ligase [Acidimicrobiia bacterium]|nr:tryptophan--tRNA ligase [Acidimicrobiia bacterium]
MARVFSGIQPSGDLHLGNFLGAVRNWVRVQDEHDAVYCIVDLHALTLRPDASELRAATLRLAQTLIAIGIDPEHSILFVQGHVPEHAELSWLMECTASFGELNRMTQFKDKSGRTDFISAGLFSYPALQAADILLYDTDLVPVGDDQRQHIELTRDIAERFNNRYGDTFVVPEHVIPPAGARVMDLQDPTAKMSKSEGEAPGTVWMLDDVGKIEKKFRRAITDSDGEVRYDPEAKPGVSNLLSILGAATDREPAAVAADYEQYGPLKSDAADAVISALEPIQKRFADLVADPAETERVLARGAERAREIASATNDRARAAVGLLPRSSSPRS